jgi:hypothetical protein
MYKYNKPESQKGAADPQVSQTVSRQFSTGPWEANLQSPNREAWTRLHPTCCLMPDGKACPCSSMVVNNKFSQR